MSIVDMTTWYPSTVGYWVTSKPACEHCWCIEEKPKGRRTRSHDRCCKCDDAKLTAGE